MRYPKVSVDKVTIDHTTDHIHVWSAQHTHINYLYKHINTKNKPHNEKCPHRPRSRFTPSMLYSATYFVSHRASSSDPSVRTQISRYLADNASFYNQRQRLNTTAAQGQEGLRLSQQQLATRFLHAPLSNACSVDNSTAFVQTTTSAHPKR